VTASRFGTFRPVAATEMILLITRRPGCWDLVIRHHALRTTNQNGGGPWLKGRRDQKYEGEQNSDLQSIAVSDHSAARRTRGGPLACGIGKKRARPIATIRL